MDFHALRVRHNGPLYRAPMDLRLSESGPHRALLVGSCLIEGWPGVIESHPYDPCSCNYALFNNLADLPGIHRNGTLAYDVQVVQIPVRPLLPENRYFHLPYDDLASWVRLLADAKENLALLCQSVLTREFPVFVLGFLVPQQNPMGRLLPRYDLRNPVFFVEQLNIALDDELKNYPNAHFVDLDQIAASFGKRFFLDDGVIELNHAAALADSPYDLGSPRIEPIPLMSEHYELRTPEFIQAMWSEIVAMYRTLRQVDQVKLVVVDLDDTLWRGVMGDKGDDVGPEAVEGWPLGLVEALLWLKKRGILLGVVSKNDEERVANWWESVMHGRLLLEDFAFRKVNWRPKSENMGEILRDACLLPRSVVFIDDNPRERAEIQEAYPDVRVLGSHPYYVRRILLWSPETQVAVVTAESEHRTEMMLAQVQRESARRQLSREEFLEQLQIAVRVERLTTPEGPRFVRAVELLNKTNQFNTTGRRRTSEESAKALQNGESLYVFDVEDRFTKYGLVGVVWVNGPCIDQWAMSCRVLGMGVERRVMEHILGELAGEGMATVRGRIIETNTNFPCRDLYSNCEFEELETGVWTRNLR